MPWAQFDDHFPDSVGALKAGVEACGLHCLASCWCAANLTDGKLPSVVATWLVGSCKDSNGDDLVARLIDADLWQRDDGDYVLTDFLTRNKNRTREMVEADRTRKAKAGRRGGRVKAQRDRQARAAALETPEPEPEPDDYLHGF